MNNKIDIKSKEFFNNELETILFIHFDAKYYFRDVEYLTKPETSEEKVSSQNWTIGRIKKAFWRLGIIEMAKLFQDSRNQHFNLIDYLENLLENYTEYDWINNLPKFKIQNWLEKLNSINFLSIRERISIQRDNYFAHTDRNPKQELTDSQITFEEINSLLNLTEEIIFKLNEFCLNTHIDLEIDGMEKAGNLLEMISIYSKHRELEIINRRDEYLKGRNNEA